MKYSGIYSGTGLWTVSEIDHHSRVTYEIMLEINSLRVRLLSRILPLTTLHSRLMADVLSGLERHLAEREALR